MTQASVDRVTEAQADFDATVTSISTETPLAEAFERFNSAVVALELSWQRLFAEAGCLSTEQQARAETAVHAYTTALQQDLTAAGYYSGAVDGIYGPQTVDAVESLQEASDLPVTDAFDRAAADALEAELRAAGSVAEQATVASTAAVQQTLALTGFWDGPVDGEWTPELTEALQEFQRALGVDPTDEVDAVTVAAFEEALAALGEEGVATASPTPTP